MHLRLSGSSKLSVALRSNLEGDESEMGRRPRLTSAALASFRIFVPHVLLATARRDAYSLVMVVGRLQSRTYTTECRSSCGLNIAISGCKAHRTMRCFSADLDVDDTLVVDRTADLWFKPTNVETEGRML